VAIDLEQDVKFNSHRLNNPDRIFFDLYSTKLASTLVGKTFDVEDGFLKKIRIAQFQSDRTRIVLEVDDLSQYNAFLLPDPFRLIIDIHGKRTARAVDTTEELAASGKSSKLAKAAAERSDAEDSGVSEPLLVAKKTPVPTPDPVSPKAANRIPKKIVEADDEDTDAPPDSGPAKPGNVKPPGKKEVSPPHEKVHPASEVAISTHGKRKSADGNDDAIATLDPMDVGPEPVPPAHGTGRVKISRSKEKRINKQTPPELEVREARPTASGDRSLIRALGLKIGRIVIDAGHGGHDTGTIGPNGLQEKDLVLDVGRRLGKLLETRLGADVVYTRQDDTFIPLETRTAIANQEQADLFVSIHANSSRDPDARGVETYYLNFTSSADALEVAARENAVSDKSIHELQDLVKKIALKEKIEESREFASNVQRSLHSGLAVKSPGLRDRGVKKAPFIVLIGANMPSILAEISFVSNPGDERRLETSEYRQRIAESLYKGISKYASGLSGVKVASRMGKSEGQ
jgi:N-acetylmuramoyl-L-alanine amidase